MTNMIKLINLFLITTLWLITSSFAANSQPLDAIAAKVNDQIITSSQVTTRANQFAKQLQTEKVTLPPRSIFLKQVLEMMIDENLQLQIAQRANVSVTDAEVNTTIKQIASEHKVNPSQLPSLLSKEGLNYNDFLKNIRTQLIIQKLQKAIILPQITVSPAEVDSYLRSAVNSDQALYLYHIEDIMVGVSETPTPAEVEAAHEKADDLLMQLQTGANFRTLAVAQSNSDQALKAGDLGWRTLAQMPDMFAQSVVKMKPGDLSDVIQTPNGFHIIHLIAVKSDPHKPNANALKTRVSEMLFQQKAEQQVQIWIQQLKAQAYIKRYPLV